MKLRVKSVKVIESNLYSRMSEDQEIIVYDLLVTCVGVDYKIYTHKHVFYGCFEDEEGFYRVDFGAKPEAHRLANRVVAKCEIDTAHWECTGKIEDEDTYDHRLEEAWSDVSDHYEY